VPGSKTFAYLITSIIMAHWKNLCSSELWWYVYYP